MPNSGYSIIRFNYTIFGRRCQVSRAWGTTALTPPGQQVESHTWSLLLWQVRRGRFPVEDSKPSASRTEAVEEFPEAAREKISDMEASGYYEQATRESTLAPESANGFTS